jgi:hypothetical protein
MQLTDLVPDAGTDGDDFAFHRLFLSRVGDKDAAGGLCLRLDTADQDSTSITQGDALNKALCDAGGCPTYMVFKDHSHHSQNYSVGTTDTSVSGPILDVLLKVK